MTFVLFVIGFVLLIFGASWLVEGSLRLARRIGISELAIGLTVVSIGTSVPELVVNVVASLHGSADLAIGNILGSNVANVLLILGVAGAIRALPIHDRTILSEVPICLAATLLVGFLANAALFSATHSLTISRIDGLILIAFFGLFLGYVYRTAKEGVVEEVRAEPTQAGQLGAWVRIVVGVLALTLGGEWVVRGALSIVATLGVSESLVGLTIVAIGTSTPELAASATAAYRGDTDVAVGNVVGSNIFNLLWVLGISALISPLPFDVVSNTDLAIVVASSALLILAMAVGRPNTIDRWEGWLFLVAYVVYLVYIALRG